MQDLEAVCERLDRLVGPGKLRRRKWRRVPYRKTPALVCLKPHGGGKTEICAACRNVSRDGLGFFHRSYVHAETPCTVTFTLLNGDLRTVEGVVARCRHVTGNVHEVGVKFDEEVNLSELIEVDLFSAVYTVETVNPERLHGRVMLVSDNVVDRKLMEQYLMETGVELLAGESEARIESWLNQPLDLVMLDFDTDEPSLERAMDMIDEAGLRPAVLALSADLTPTMKARMREFRPSGFLRRPVKKEELWRAMSEFLLVEMSTESGRGPVLSTLADGCPESQLLPDFVEELHKAALSLAEAVKEEDVPAFRRACVKLKGTAPAMGFAVIAQVAERAVQALDRSGNLRDSHVAAAELIEVCRRAKIFTRAAG